MRLFKPSARTRLFGIDRREQPVVAAVGLQVAQRLGQARHQGLTLWLSGQDLLTVPDELLGLATQVLCFRLNSPLIFNDVRRRVSGYGATSFKEVSALLPGEALWVTQESTDPTWRGSAERVYLRPPTCAHGGHTRAML